jgi:hypothetical protein
MMRDTQSNNGMHPTRDTTDFIYLQGLGRGDSSPGRALQTA